MGGRPGLNDEWLRQCSNDVLYEYWMMLLATFVRRDGVVPEDPLLELLWQNTLLESARIHWRCLAFFFFAGTKGAKGAMNIWNEDQQDANEDADLLARYYVGSWAPPEPPDRHFLDEYRRTHKQIAHLTLFRARQRQEYVGDKKEYLNVDKWDQVSLARPIISCMTAFMAQCRANEAVSRRIAWAEGNFRTLALVERQLLAVGALSSGQCVAATG